MATLEMPATPDGDSTSATLDGVSTPPRTPRSGGGENWNPQTPIPVAGPEQHAVIPLEKVKLILALGALDLKQNNQSPLKVLNRDALQLLFDHYEPHNSFFSPGATKRSTETPGAPLKARRTPNPDLNGTNRKLHTVFAQFPLQCP